MKKWIINQLLEADYRIEMVWISKDILGSIDRESKIIYLNLWSIIYEILLHEFIHYKSPEYDEEEIVEKTFKMLKGISVQEIIQTSNTLLKKYCEELGGE